MAPKGSSSALELERNKYEKLKRKFKEMADSYEEMGNRIDGYKARIARLRRERDLLADRVREHEGGYESSGLEDNVSDGGDLDAEAAKLKRDRPKKKPRTEAPAGPSAPSTGHAPETVFTAPAPRAAAPAHPVHQVATPVSVVKQSTLSQLSTPVQFQARPMAVASPQVSLPHVSPMQMPSYAGTPQHFTPMPSASGSAPPSFSISESPLESGKKGSKSKAPKEKKPAAPKKPRKVQTVPRDAAGWPILPYKVGSHFTIHNLGTIVTDREAFHTERYVYPVGYRISRPYQSTQDPNKTVEVFCSIEDGGAPGPIFRVEPSDAPALATSASSPTGAWSPIIRAANLLRNKEGSSASGPELFGFTNATIHALLQELPGVEQLKKYEKEEYELVPPKGPSKRARAKARKEEGDESEGGSGLPEDEDEFSGMEE